MIARLATVALLAASVAHAAPGDGNPKAEAGRENPEEQMARGKQAYGRGDYEAVIQTLRPLLYPDPVVAFDAEVAAHKLLAMSYFFQREVNLAEQEFVALLQLKEDFALDPVFDPVSAIKFLERIRQRNREKLDESSAQRKREEDQRRREEEQRKREEELRKREDAERLRLAAQAIERTIVKHPFVLSFVPFGVGQFQNGERRKAWALLTTQVILGAGSVALWAAVYFGYAGRSLTADEREMGNMLSYAQVTAGVLFWVDVIAGVIDAAVHHVPEVITERRLVPSPKTTSVAPFASPGGGGLAVQGAF